jgi:competence transcription factor ComK
MKPFNKEEYNRICAEFMGLVEAKPYKTAYTTNNATKLPTSFSELVHSEMEGESWYVYPKFDTDWNWIMEVVDKIQYYKTLIISNNHCEIHFMPNDGIRINVGCRTTKEAVIQAIWEFLKWYKEQQK